MESLGLLGLLGIFRLLGLLGLSDLLGLMERLVEGVGMILGRDGQRGLGTYPYIITQHSMTYISTSSKSNIIITHFIISTPCPPKNDRIIYDS